VELRDYLQDIAKKTRECCPNAPFLNLQEFVLKYGREFEFESLPESIRPGEIKECFKNAFSLASGRKFIYCEGYATADNIPIAIFHAWCVTSEGIVVDRTWIDYETPRYIGIPFRLEYALSVLMERKYYGVIEMNQELLSGKVPKNRWLEVMRDVGGSGAKSNNSGAATVL
jgi:hypothetical protein